MVYTHETIPVQSILGRTQAQFSSRMSRLEFHEILIKVDAIFKDYTIRRTTEKIPSVP